MEATVTICFIFGVFTIIAFHWFKWTLEKYEYQIHCLEKTIDDIRGQIYKVSRTQDDKLYEIDKNKRELEYKISNVSNKITMLDNQIDTFKTIQESYFRGNK